MMILLAFFVSLSLHHIRSETLPGAIITLDLSIGLLFLSLIKWLGIRHALSISHHLLIDR